jgi:hypothetical protein
MNRIGNLSGRRNVETAGYDDQVSPRGTHVRRLLLATIPLLLLSACAEPDPDPAAPRQAAQRQEQRYETTSTVLQSPEHGPELCLGVVALSLPPQCRGLPIPNWRWDQVTGQESHAGTTWGRYRLVGTYDGASFTVIRADRPPPAAPRPSAAERFKDEPKTPCPEPAWGWPVPDPAKASEEDMQAAWRAAQAQPDFAGLWLSYLEPMGHNVAEDPGEFVLNVAFTGDLQRHEVELRTRWGGRLCVTRQPRTMAELHRIQRELGGAVGKELGLRVVSTSRSDDENVVNLEVLVLDEQTRQAIQERYGAGAVRATATLTPVQTATG